MSAMSTLPEFTHSPSCSCLLPRTLRCQDATCSHPVTTRRAAHSVKRRQQQPARCDDRMGAPQPDRDPSIRFEPPKQKANKNFNPFKNVKKEDAVRSALQDTFKGKEDLLAVYDRPPPGGGKGGSGGGRGGNWWNSFGSGGGFNPSDWGNWVKNALRRLGKTLGAVLLFMLILGAMALWQPVLAGGTRLLCILVLAFFLPPLAVFLHKEACDSDFWLNLLLTIVTFWILGIIHAYYVILKHPRHSFGTGPRTI
eukprot:jgi/Astpho2/3246/fgenesh1_pg.00052_%23_49_t